MKALAILAPLALLFAAAPAAAAEPDPHHPPAAPAPAAAPKGDAAKAPQGGAGCPMMMKHADMGAASKAPGAPGMGDMGAKMGGHMRCMEKPADGKPADAAPTEHEHAPPKAPK